MRQRVMIALALACDPEVIVADEPTTALDVMAQAQVLALLDELRRDLGLALLLITHDLAVIAETCERVAVMYAGRIVETGPTSTVFAVPQHPYTQRLLGAFPLVGGERALAPAIPGTAPDPSDPPSGCRFHPRCHLAREACEHGETALRAVGDDHESACLFAPLQQTAVAGRPAMSTRPLAAAVTPLAEARGLEVTFRRRGRVVRALDGVDLEWRRNEVLGVVGESGCGKSTLARTLLGLVPPSGGELRFEGATLDRGGRRNLRRTVQMVFQDPYQSLNPRMRVSELVQEPLRMQGIARPERVLRAANALEDAGLAPAERFWHRYPFELSGGQRQRVAIASALAPEPAGLVCDEPVSALDLSVRAQVLHLLLGLRRARGLALLLITHDIGLAWSLCDRVAVMYLGRVIELGTAADVIERPQHPYTQALVAVAPSTRPRAGRPRGRPGRRGARHLAPPGRLPLPPALPARARALRRRGRRAAAERRRGPDRGLLVPRSRSAGTRAGGVVRRLKPAVRS